MIKKINDVAYIQFLAMEIAKYVRFSATEIYGCILMFESVDIVIDAAILADEQNKSLSRACEELYYEQNKR